MQGRGGGSFAGFGGFGSSFGPSDFGGFGSSEPSGFGGFGSLFGPSRSLISSVLGGRDPFDDPFFSQPFGGMFGSSPFGGATGFPFLRGMHPSGFPEHQALASHPSGFSEGEGQAPELITRRGPIIQELDSDDENEDATEEKKANPRKHGRSDDEADDEQPDDEIEGKKSKNFQAGNEFSGFNSSGSQSQALSYATVPQPQFHRSSTVHQPQSHSFCFQSTTVSYGGPNGTYYTSSRTRRSGSDGVTFEESKEADSSTREASHIVSRGIHGKGHSLSRKLNSDGRVDSMQTLHNINEDELADFEEEWKGKGQKYFPGWTGSIEGTSNNGQAEQARQRGWALPSTEHNNNVGTISQAGDRVGSSRTQERARTNSSGRSAHRAGRRA